MKRKIVCILVCMLMCVTFTAVTGKEIFDENAKSSDKLNTTIFDRDMWDLQFHYDVGGLSGSIGHVGAAFDGTYFYCGEFNGANIYRFDHDGNYIDSFTISGVTNLIDLAYDGTYVYGPSTTGNVLYQMDMDSQTLVDSISLPSVSYNVAFDADADGGNGGFWISQWQNHLTLIDRSGSVLDSITPVPESMLGMAWDPYTIIDGYNGPFLWIFTGTSTGAQAIIKVIDLDTKEIITEVEHNVALDIEMGIAGGLGLTIDWEPGIVTLYGIVQGADPIDDYLFGYELFLTNKPPLTPDAPDGPDEGVVTEEYEFSASTTDPDEDMIQYGWDIDGDFVVDEWSDFLTSGATSTVTTSYDSPGTYNIRVKARDENELESGWSSPHSIVITELPNLKVIDIPGTILKVTPRITNNGPVDANGVNWAITLEGGIIIAGGGSGTIDMPSGQDITLDSGIILGIGSVTIRVTLDHPLSSASKIRKAFVLGFLIF